MAKKNNTPFYRRRPFWAVALVVFILAATGAGLILSKKVPLDQAQLQKTGKLEIKTEPEGAVIRLDDNERREKSNATLSAPVGKHKIKLQLADYDDQEIEVEVTENGTAPISHAFTKNGLSVRATPGTGADGQPQPELLTYTNPKYGYSLQYPANWRVETDPGGTPHFYNAFIAKQFNEQAGQGDSHNHAEELESLAVLVSANPGNLGAKAWYEAREEFAAEDQSQIKKRELSLSGTTAYQYETPYGFVPYVNTVVTGKGQAFLLQQKQGSPDRQVYDGIAQSFKLL